MKPSARYCPGLTALVLFAAGIASACTIPVFRYALDRWEADPFRLVVPKAWATDREKVKLLVPLRGNAVANVLVEESDDPTLDRARLLFPHDDLPLWEGALDSASMEPLLDSPARRALLERLLAGDSVVWVVATRGSDGKEALDRIASRLRFLEQVAELPVQNPDDPDSQLGPGPELMLKFSVLPLSLDDPAERTFATMLAGPTHPALTAGGAGFAAPVFGRGRVLGAWPLDELDDITLEDTSLFLTGRCSCRVKNDNPGWDLLLKVDWESALSRAAEAPQSSAPTASPPVPASDPVEITVTPAASPALSDRTPRLSWDIVGIGLAVIFALAGWRLWRVR